MRSSLANHLIQSKFEKGASDRNSPPGGTLLMTENLTIMLACYVGVHVIQHFLALAYH